MLVWWDAWLVWTYNGNDTVVLEKRFKAFEEFVSE
jgi:hypothetical protein